ncbi:MAG: hypothetical protein ACOCVJ_04045 [Verrucomicrobiota bacterium]
MEAILEALKGGNIVAWVIVGLLLVLILKLLQSAGKGLMILIVIVGVVMVLYRFFPGLVAPLVEFVEGGWLGDNR